MPGMVPEPTASPVALAAPHARADRDEHVPDRCPARARAASCVDQVDALRRMTGVDLERVRVRTRAAQTPTVRAATDLRRRHGCDRFDVVHAHFGLTAWPALAARGAGACASPSTAPTSPIPARARSRSPALPLLDLVATVSEPLAAEVPRGPCAARARVLPCGVDIARFRPSRARRPAARSGSTRPVPTCCSRPIPAAPRSATTARCRRGRRAAAGAGHVDPAPGRRSGINAANAVLVPSEREGFGLAVLEALACDVPVLATPVGIARRRSRDRRAYCGPFDESAWRAALAPHFAGDDPRVDGRARAERFSTDRMAARVVATWRDLLSP